MIGHTLGDFDLLEEIGRGGMGVVYRARQRSLGRDVAVKVLPPELAREGQVATRFRSEAQRMAQLDHPGIASVYAVGEEGGVEYFAMQYLPGGSLQDRLERASVSAEQAAEIAAQVADALDHAHGQGVIHRDIKPANIMFDGQGRPVVTDFGIAKAVMDPKLTATGMALGTPHYMAPEQVRGNPVDGRADIYALGVVLYEMLCGRPPFAGETPFAVAMKHVTDAPLAPSMTCPGLPAGVETVVLRAMAKEPGDRFPRAGEMAVALRSASPAAQHTARVEPHRKTTVLLPPSPPPSRALAFLIGLCAILGAGLIVMVAMRGCGPSPPPDVVVPDVVGTEVAKATETLRVAGLRPTVEPARPDPAHPPGTVCEQTPSAGSRVNKDAEIRLVPTGGVVDSVPVQSDEEMIRALVEKWRSTWEGNRIEEHLTCFWPDAVVDKRNLASYRRYLEQEARDQPMKSVGAGGLDISVNGDRGQAKFVQNFHGWGGPPEKRWTSQGSKALRLRRQNGEWRIVGEVYDRWSGRRE
ncbi:MAG: protein kinase [Armatimonadetes bacterium]|nr:protein kinase [Armatimonadota bacterium]